MYARLVIEKETRYFLLIKGNLFETLQGFNSPPRNKCKGGRRGIYLQRTLRASLNQPRIIYSQEKVFASVMEKKSGGRIFS